MFESMSTKILSSRSGSRWAALLFATSVGCGSGGSGDDGVGGGSDGDVIGSADGLRLEVRDSIEQGRLGEVFAGPEARFVLVSMRLDNDLHQAPVSVAPPLFFVRTSAGVEFVGSVFTDLLAQPCRVGTQVAQGGHYECSLAFEVPYEDEVAALVYRPDQITEVVVPFESERCAPCGDDCVDLSADPNHCGECSRSIGPEQTCKDGVATCVDGLTACGPDCVDTRIDRDHCGACFSAIPTEQVCMDGSARCPDTAPIECGSECADLQTDLDHCGECGREVEMCMGGEPACENDREWCSGACTSIYSNPAHCGGCDNVCVGENECRSGDCVTYHTSINTVATCFGVCNSLGLGCSAGEVLYVGTQYCAGGGGFDDEWVPLGCNDIPESTFQQSYDNGCTFYGDASQIGCWCLQS